MEAVRLLFVSIPGVDRANPFGFLGFGAVSRRRIRPRGLRCLGFAWISRPNWHFSRVERRDSGKLFFPRLSSRARRRSGSPALAREMSGLVMARRLSRILIFCNDLSIRQDSSTPRSLRFAKARLQSLSLGRTAEPMQPERPPIAYDRPSDPVESGGSSPPSPCPGTANACYRDRSATRSWCAV